MEPIKYDKISPYRLNQMVKTAAKISEMLLVPANFLGDYEEAEFIIELVQHAIQEAKDKNRNE